MNNHDYAQKRYYWANKEKCKLSKQRSNEKLKKEVLTHYSLGELKCAKCNETDIMVLCIDHINGKGEEHRKSMGVIGGIAFYRKLKNLNYPDGFQVLCANCNLKKEIMKHRGIE